MQLLLHDLDGFGSVLFVDIEQADTMFDKFCLQMQHAIFNV